MSHPRPRRRAATAAEQLIKNLFINNALHGSEGSNENPRVVNDSSGGARLEPHPVKMNNAIIEAVVSEQQRVRDNPRTVENLPSPELIPSSPLSNRNKSPAMSVPEEISQLQS